MTKSFSRMNNQKGMTLVEIIVSIAILSIIIVTFLTFFIQSTKVNNVSKDITDSSYIAQSEMEEIYNLSNTMSYTDTITYLSNSYTVNSSDSDYDEFTKQFEEDGNIYNIDIKIKTTITNTPNTTDNLKDVIVNVKNNSDKLEAQLETKLLWES